MYHHTNIHTSLFNEDSSWSSITIYLYVQALCNNMNAVLVHATQYLSLLSAVQILVSVCHLPENFCTLSMTRSIRTVPFAFLINVSSLILSWLLLLPLPTHCTTIKDTVHYYTVTYMLLIWRRLNDLFSYKNIVNSNSQYLALQHVLFIYRMEPWL